MHQTLRPGAKPKVVWCVVGSKRSAQFFMSIVLVLTAVWGGLIALAAWEINAKAQRHKGAKKTTETWRQGNLK